jgi:Activator of Hsp90 ATPase homolog 1-like protein
VLNLDWEINVLQINFFNYKTGNMQNQDYHYEFTAAVSADEAYDAINDVKAWWARCFEGHAQAVHDTFAMPFGKTWLQFVVIELQPGRKVVWLVTDCNIEFVQDKKEWKGTQVIFDIIPSSDGVRVAMTHIGLLPELECYDNCEKGWNKHIGESLRKLLIEKIGAPA